MMLFLSREEAQQHLSKQRCPCASFPSSSFLPSDGKIQPFVAAADSSSPLEQNQMINASSLSLFFSPFPLHASPRGFFLFSLSCGFFRETAVDLSLFLNLFFP